MGFWPDRIGPCRVSPNVVAARCERKLREDDWLVRVDCAETHCVSNNSRTVTETVGIIIASRSIPQRSSGSPQVANTCVQLHFCLPVAWQRCPDEPSPTVSAHRRHRSVEDLERPRALCSFRYTMPSTSTTGSKLAANARPWCSTAAAYLGHEAFVRHTLAALGVSPIEEAIVSRVARGEASSSPPATPTARCADISRPRR
jgi:hypothetical protein